MDFTKGKPTMKVIVVGGSMAGLMHAIVLQNLGHQVHILEKLSRSQLHSQAAGLRVGPDVKRFIDVYFHNHSPYAITLDTITQSEKNGVIESETPAREPLHLTTWGFLHRWFLSRLRDGIADNPAAFDTERKVEQVTYQDGKLSVVYSNTKDNSSEILPADLVIATDGAHSVVRQTLFPHLQPAYAGYVTWRGAVPESIVSQESKVLFLNRVVMFRTAPGYIISYNVPSDGGSQESGRSQFIWVWYDMLPEGTDEFNDTFTDNMGKRHQTTIPRGRMQAHIWKKRQELGNAVLSPPFKELLQKTTDPFISAIRDSSIAAPTFHDRKVLFAGDSLCLFRPHVGLSTNQAAKQALELREVLEGRISWDEWEESSSKYAELTGKMSVAYGEYLFTGVAYPELRAWLKPVASQTDEQRKSNL